MAVGTSPYDAADRYAADVVAHMARARAAEGGTHAASADDDAIRVLIADDEPALRVALADLLEHEDRLTLIGSAGDANEAIQIAVEERPDVALIDVKMPEGGGARAAREILRASPDTRVIALSAFEDRPTVLEMLRAGAVGYLVKGTAGDEIVGSIRKVVAGGASLSSEVISGIVQELTHQLQREDAQRRNLEARRSEIQRFVGGEGLSMVYQPIVELDSRATVGFEALARFLSFPLRAPDEWFAEAVSLELGVGLELSAIEQALREFARIPEHAYLAVNCSQRAAASEEVAELLAPHAPRLVLEITEHEAVEDYDGLVAALQPLRDHGLRVAIDDAGAGFASLQHTLRIAPDIVKLDLSITRDIDTDRGKRALATALMSFAEEMSMTMIAEGIETAAELEALTELGIRFGQGFYLAEPGPLE
jgi:EAL domain-containing protein (putative c-di-GMP-specific phosphodiesterase class I)/AmiR/NasT family two-component response regulator